MKVGTKVITLRELPETDSRPYIPSNTECDVALFGDLTKQHEMHQQGFTFVRVVIRKRPHFIFLPTDSLCTKT